MNIFRKLTMRSLVKNKMRTVVTVIGIILSAAMFTAVTTSISTFQDCMCKNAIYHQGNWHIMVGELSADDTVKVCASDEVKSSCVSQNIGFAKTESDNADKPYIFLMGANEEFYDNMPVYLTSGRLPENSSEVIIPRHLKDNGGVKYSEGDKITCEIGSRVNSDGTPVDNPAKTLYNIGEELSCYAERTYTVVGVYLRADFESYSSPGYTCITSYDDKLQGSTYNAYLYLTNPNNAYDISSDFYCYSNVTEDNSDLLMCLGISGYKGFYSVLYAFAGFLIALIMFGSISLIYNAFAISVSERTKQFGLLSSVGATRKQIRAMVVYEALIVSAIGIPIGILSGILGIGVTITALGEKFVSLFGNSQIVPTLSVSLMSIIIAAVIAFVTVIISALIPSKRAMRVTAIEAIRQTQDIKISSAKAVRTSKLTYALFGIEGAIAKKHFKRNKKRNRAAVLSLFMSIVLFISASSFCMFLTNAVNGVFSNADCDILISYTNDKEQTAILYDKIKDIEGVKNSAYVYIDSGNTTLTPELYSKKFKKVLGSDSDENKEVTAMILAVPDDIYMSYLKKNGFDTARYMDKDNPIALGYAKYIGFSVSLQKVVDYDILNTDSASFDLGDGMIIDCDLKVDKLISGLNFNSEFGINVMYPLSVYEANWGKDNDAIITVSADDPNKTCDVVYDVLEKQGGEYGVTNLYDNAATSRNLVTIINVFSYGFIVLISLIALANVFNTMATNIQLRKREFAMLKTIGMTNGGIQKMLNYECILYGVRSLALGLPTSIALTYLMFKTISMGYDGSFFIPWVSVAISIGSVFIVVFFSMMYSMGRINKENLIDTVKNENL